MRPAVPPSRKPLAAHVGGGPDQIADALEAEHRVVDEERNHVDAVRGVGGAGGDERRHRAGLGDAFFEDLPVLRFAIVEHAVGIDRLVELADVASRCRTGGRAPPCRRCAPRRARSARCTCRCFLSLQQLAEQPHEGHRGRDFAVAAAVRRTRRTPRAAALRAAAARRPAPARSRPAPCAARADTASRGCRPAGL